jgi:DNA-binding PadR family transcriptional regulator
MPKKGTRPINNLLGLAVLALLDEGPAHPYELDRKLRERKKEKSIRLNYGSLYMVVEQLTKAGFTAARKTERDGQRPERTVYVLTDAGREELRHWMRDLVGTWRKEFHEFETALALIYVLPPSEGLRLLEQRSEQLGEQIDSARAEIADARANGVQRLFLVEGEYRLSLAEAERAFVKSLINEVRKNDSDIARVWRAFRRTGVKHD